MYECVSNFITPQLLKTQTPGQLQANATANIVTPIAITCTQDLDFGSIAAASVADEVVMSPAECSFSNKW